MSQINHITAPHLNYTLCTGPDTLSTHSFMLNMHTSSARRRAQLPLSDLAGAYWSVRGHVGEREVNQSHVTKMAEKLQESGFDNIKIMLDTEWQATHGDLAFDPKRFPNITKMFDDLSRVDCRLTLCVSPYFQYSSRNFQKVCKIYQYCPIAVAVAVIIFYIIIVVVAVVVIVVVVVVVVVVVTVLVRLIDADGLVLVVPFLFFFAVICASCYR